MFITQELRDGVEERLRMVETRARWLEDAASWPSAQWSDLARVWAAERALHIATECVTDAAARVIDALVFRDPGDYTDILRVLQEEGVVESTWFNEFCPMVAIRTRLVRAYVDLKNEEVIAAVRTHGPQFRTFVSAVRTYLGISSR